MNLEVSLFSAFLVGLIGSTHCLGMCGGIVGALTLGLDDRTRQRAPRMLVYLITYNVGRISSYALAGAVAGLLGTPLIASAAPAMAGRVVQWVSAGFMVALGLYLAGWWPGLQRIEQWGGHLWSRLEPVGRRLLPVNNPLKAFGFGVVWGWLPCGLVYTALVWSLASGSAIDGAARMAAFGAGTLPMMLLAGSAAGRLAGFVRKPWVRRAAGIAILLLGLFLGFAPVEHHHNGDMYPSASPHGGH